MKKTTQGEFRADVTRDTFDPAKHFSRVLLQQGRPLLDADWNEQTSILLHYLQTLARDIIGPHGGPQNDLGFTLKLNESDKKLFLSKGRYYVNGILCENENDHDISGLISKDGEYLVYLDVWEEHVSALQDLSIREVALGDADTATRSRVCWKLRAIKGTSQQDPAELIKAQHPPKRGELKAYCTVNDGMNEPCTIPPTSAFRGKENQLYRVEIHNGGGLHSATFKWSRDNSSNLFIISSASGKTIVLDDLGKDSTRTINVGDWVECLKKQPDGVCTDSLINKLSQVDVVNIEDRTLTLKNEIDGGCDFLRRWDHNDGDQDGIKTIKDHPFKLEDGIEVQFTVDNLTTTKFQAGDYWLIPARVATGDIEWPRDTSGGSEFIPPHGIEHHYAPLSLLTKDGGSYYKIINLQNRIQCCNPVLESIERNFITLPNGSYRMGTDGNQYPNETPQTVIVVPAFAISKFEVTQKQFRFIMGFNPSAEPKGDDLPVNNVSWEEAKEFCSKLSLITGKTYRLPSEAEWEYAARGGTSNAYSFGASDEELHKYAWFDPNSSGQPWTVGTKLPNPFGLYDMHGNVREWCEDDYHDNYQGRPTDGSAWIDQPRAEYRVLRGGGWYDPAVGCRSANRGGDTPGYRYGNLGFRLSRTLP